MAQGRDAFGDQDAFDYLARDATGTARVKMTYDLQPSTISAIRDIAQRERFGKKGYSAVAAAMLEYAVRQYQAGAVQFEMHLDGDEWVAMLVDAS